MEYDCVCVFHQNGADSHAGAGAETFPNLTLPKLINSPHSHYFVYESFSFTSVLNCFNIFMPSQAGLNKSFFSVILLLITATFKAKI